MNWRLQSRRHQPVSPPRQMDHPTFALTTKTLAPLLLMSHRPSSYGRKSRRTRSAKSFLALKGSSGYYKIKTEKCGRDKNVYPSYYNLSRFSRIPFRLKNASALFHGAMCIILFLMTARNSIPRRREGFSELPMHQMYQVCRALELWSEHGVALTLKARSSTLIKTAPYGTLATLVTFKFWK